MPLIAQLTVQNTFHGPSPLGPEPLVVVLATFGGQVQQGAVLGLRKRLAAALPACSLVFAQATEGTVTAEIACVASELSQALMVMGRATTQAHGCQVPCESQALFWLGFHEPRFAVAAIRLSLEIVSALLESEALPPQMLQSLESFVAACAPHHPDICSRHLVLGAASLGLPCRKQYPGGVVWQYGQGAWSERYQEATPLNEGVLGYQLSGNKLATRRFLGGLGFPVTEQRAVHDEAEGLAAAAALGWPVVVKPSGRGKGIGVSVGIRDMDTLRKALRVAQAESRGKAVVVERHLDGDDYRLLVVRGRLVSAIRREPPFVCGDGARPLRELISDLNVRREAKACEQTFYVPVPVDELLHVHLSIQGLNMDSIPKQGQRVTLRGNSNISTGGTTTACLDILHPDQRELAESIARNAGLQVVGIDYITTDISRSWRETGGAVIEINCTPGIFINQCETRTEAEIGVMILGSALKRLPATLIVGPEEELRQAEAGMPALNREGSAYMGPSGLRLNGKSILSPGESLLERLHALEDNRDSRGLVLAWTPEMLLGHGLPETQFEAVFLTQGCALPKPWLELLQRHSKQLFVLQKTEPPAQ